MDYLSKEYKSYFKRRANTQRQGFADKASPPKQYRHIKSKVIANLEAQERAAEREYEEAICNLTGKKKQILFIANNSIMDQDGNYVSGVPT